MKSIISFIKKEIVFSIACVLAVVSAFFVTPSKEYVAYIDFRTLALLLALMLVVQGFKSCGIFDSLVRILIKHASTKRQLAFILVLLCFFSSMLITNDVALITFVPFTIIILDLIQDAKYSIYIIVLETVAANLGSMFTPIGNPQNLYLYSISDMDIMSFLVLMLPYTTISLILLIIAMMLIKPEALAIDTSIFQISNTCKKTTKETLSLFVYISLFLLSILTVLHIVDFRLMLAIVIIAILILSPKLIIKADYILLLTFIAFFIFIGNLKNLPAINNLLASLVDGRECFVAVLASQIVSNVPCAMLLSGFTSKFDQLIIGTNLGGLGTLIASMASLISYKFYAKIKTSNIKKYVLAFTLINIIFLIILSIFYILIN